MKSLDGKWQSPTSTTERPTNATSSLKPTIDGKSFQNQSSEKQMTFSLMNSAYKSTYSSERRKQQ